MPAPDKSIITIDPHSFNTALDLLHEPARQSLFIQEQIRLVRHRFAYIQATPLKVLSQDSGFHKILYLHEQHQLHCLLDELHSLHNALPDIRASHEQGIYECLRNIVYNPELDYSRYELAKEIVSHRTVVCHIQIAAMNIISVMLIDPQLQTREEIRLFIEEIFTYFLIERPTTAACVNNRLTQALSLYFSFMPEIISTMLRKKLKLIRRDKTHPIENSAFINRLLTNFTIYFSQIEPYSHITEQHHVYDVVMFYKDLNEVDNSSIELADDVMGVILKNKVELLDFLEEIFTYHTPAPATISQP